MELELVKYLGKIDAAIVAGQTFKSFGAEQADTITGSEILVSWFQEELFVCL